ncbi:hypothetical protein [Streptomyces aquilus]|uniref:hypothetical protein n=1 Tax=Streptomyces aquilus TaxID=2548456 RepID=UPI0036B8511C
MAQAFADGLFPQWRCRPTTSVPLRTTNAAEVMPSIPLSPASSDGTDFTNAIKS